MRNQLFNRTTAMLGALFSCMVSGVCLAYDTDTHAWITFQGYIASKLNPVGANAPAALALRERLGFDRLEDSTPFRVPFDLPFLVSNQADAYLDLLPNAPPFNVNPNPFRSPQEYERLQFVVARAAGSSLSLYSSPLTVEASLVRGAIREDDLYQADYAGAAPDLDPYGEIRRVAWHFWDPANDLPLTLPPPVQPLTCSNSTIMNTACIRSIDAAMGVEDALAQSYSPALNRRNHFSWVDARESFWRAITLKTSNPSVGSVYAQRQATDAALRKNYWNTTLVSIGHVVHLLQDSAQPQHTRNDRHNPGPLASVGFPGATLARRTMEAFANYRITADVQSLAPGEQQVFRAMFNGPAEQRLLAPPPIGTYPIPQFSTPVKFFSTKTENATLNSRRGLADFSNRGFFTEGTLPGIIPNFASPPPDIGSMVYTTTDFDQYAIPLYGTIVGRKLMWSVPDPVAPNYVDSCAVGGRTPAATVSSLSDFQQLSTGTLNFPAQLALDDYKCHQDILIPRAIAYTTGVINYFFRGELEVTTPVQLVIGAVDQGIPHTVDADGYPRRVDNDQILGFNKIRLRVRNITPDILESGSGNTIVQNLGGSAGPSVGKLVAIARYHRNPCYSPEMTGERRVPMPFNGTVSPPSNCGPIGSRTRYQEISVSAQMDVAPGELGAGASSTAVDKVFDFSSDPIPINATDLFVQVAYRGPLGQESDGVALGTYDAREPMFVGYWNNTDYYSQNGVWAPSTGTAGIFSKAGKSFQLCAGIGTDRVVLIQRLGISTDPALQIPQPAGLLRFAVLTAKPVTTENVVLRGSISFFEPQPTVPYIPLIIGIKGNVNQANKENIGLDVTPFPLAASPFTACPTSVPAGQTFLWCVEPIQVRRGIAGGKIAQPVFLSSCSRSRSKPAVLAFDARLSSD